MLRINVSRADTAILETETITAGRAGLQCGFTFSADWDGLAKIVVVNGTVKRDVVLVNDTIIVPAECLATANYTLRIGVCGASGDGEIVIPTLWTNFGKILPSAQPGGVGPEEVTPDVVAQINRNSSDALRLAQEVLRRADSGEFDGRDGATGPAGKDGRDGIDGQYGAKGEKGDPGEDGFSPEVSVAAITGGHRVTITDASGPESFEVMDGSQGQPGTQGATGPAGFSPTVDIDEISGGYELTITDAQGEHTATIYSGAASQDANGGVIFPNPPAADGNGVPAGGTQNQVLKKASSTDYATYWADEAAGVFWATYNTTTEAEITAAVTAGQAVLCKISDEIFYLASKAAIGPSGSAWIFASANQTSMRVTWVSGSYWNSIGTRTIPSSASDIGAIAAPSSPATGAFLVWNGTAWVAQTMSAWQGGNY